MAPRTRSNRAEKLAKEKLLARGVVLNSRGFPALPNELFMEIISYFPAMPVPQVVWLEEKTDPHRHVTLLALCQTCKALRTFFLRHAWERIEVFGGMWTPLHGRLVSEEEERYRSWETRILFDKKFGEEVLRQLEVVTVQNPELAQHVRIINLLFVNSSHERIILPEVARVLSLLPNVNTLQISITFSIFRDYFTEYSYPQIHTVYLYGDLLSDNILGACPNLRRFFHSSISRRHRFPPVLPTCTTQIEELGVLSASRHGGSPLLSAVIRQFPHLREVSVDFNLLRLEQDDFEQISLLALQTLRLYFGRWKPPSYGPAVLPTSDERDKWISMAKKVLKSCPSREGDSSKRILMVINEDRSLETYPVFAYRDRCGPKTGLA